MTQAPNKCSRAGCVNEATKVFEWRNPNVHRDGRTKLWGSCEQHVEFFTDYLGAREFLLEVRSL